MDATPTTGQLLALPDLNLYTLEDPWLDNQKGISCIPMGTYRCIFSMSQRFHRLLPELLNVPGRTGIRIHAGNTTSDTEGCPLVGMTRDRDMVLYSQKALGYFKDWLADALMVGAVYCEVTCG
jgi:hypothetical protein